MGCSWWSFATKSSNYDNLVAIDNKPATLLIPEFAISWANNQSQLTIKHAGDYADFYMKNGYDNNNQINGHLLIAIFDMNSDRVHVCEENLEHYVTDDEMSEIEDILEEYDVSLEQALHVALPVNDALVVAFEGFKRAYEELLEKEN